MAGSTLLFIEQTPSGLGSTDRRAVRSHVMKGKNAGRPRPTYKQRRDATHPSHKGDFNIPQVVIWHSFSLTAFPEKLDPVSVKLMHRWFLDISDTLFPPQFCDKFDIVKSVFVNCILADEAYFHSTLAISGSYIDFHDRRLATSPKSLQHISKAYSLVGSKLSSLEATSDLALACVVNLAVYQQIHQQHVAGLIHLKGLCRMIDVRGGIVQLVKESPMMALKALRLDVELALQNGTPTVFHLTDLPIRSILCEPYVVSRQYLQLTAGHSGIMLDLVVFASILNDCSDAKVSPWDYTETTTSFIYRLLDEDLSCQARGGQDDLSRLAMLAFMTTFLPEYCRNNFSCSPLGSRLLLAIHLSQTRGLEDELALLLWAIFMGSMSVLKGHDDGWWLVAIRKISQKLGLLDWSSAREQLVAFPWVHTLHDRPGRNLWQRAQDSGRNRLQDSV